MKNAISQKRIDQLTCTLAEQDAVGPKLRPKIPEPSVWPQEPRATKLPEQHSMLSLSLMLSRVIDFSEQRTHAWLASSYSNQRSGASFRSPALGRHHRFSAFTAVSRRPATTADIATFVAMFRACFVFQTRRKRIKKNKQHASRFRWSRCCFGEIN